MGGDIAEAQDFGAELVIGSDLCYSHNQFVPVLKTLEALKPRLGAILTTRDQKRRVKIAEMRRFAESRGWSRRPLQRQKCDAAFLRASAEVRTGLDHSDEYQTVALVRAEPYISNTSGELQRELEKD